MPRSRRSRSGRPCPGPRGGEALPSGPAETRRDRRKRRTGARFGLGSPGRALLGACADEGARGSHAHAAVVLSGSIVARLRGWGLVFDSREAVFFAEAIDFSGGLIRLNLRRASSRRISARTM